MKPDLIAFDVAGPTAPEAPYPSAIRAGAYLFISGQVAFDEHGQVVAEGDIYGQTLHCIRRLEEILEHFGLQLGHIASSTVFLTDAGMAEVYNRAWAEGFGSHRPARATVVSSLLDPRLLVEIQAVAHIGER